MPFRKDESGNRIDITIPQQDNVSPGTGMAPDTQSPLNGLTAEQVASAQLFLPKAQAEALKNAFDIQQSGMDTELKRQEQQTKLDEATKTKKAVETTRNMALQVIREMQDGGGVEILSGTSGTKLNPYTWFAGTSFQDKKAKFDQLKGMLSLKNREQLKGTGTISDYESRILESASSALNTNMSDDAFVKELEKVRLIMDPNYEMTEDGIVDKTTGKVVTPEETMGIKPQEDVVKKTIKAGLSNMPYVQIPKMLQSALSQPAPKQTGNAITDTITQNPVSNLLLGPAVNVAQDVGTGIQQQNQQPQLQKLEETAGQFESQAMETQDPEQRKVLLDNANQVRKEISGISGKTSRSFTEEVNNNPLLRSLLAASSIASTAEIAGAIPGVIKGLTNTTKAVGNQLFNKAEKEAIDTIVTKPVTDATGKFVQTVQGARKYTPGSILGKKQSEAAAKSLVKPDVKVFMDAGENAAKYDPRITTAMRSQYLDGAKKINSLSDLLEAMQTWGDVAYTKGGTTKSIAQARLANGYYAEALKILETQAPEVYKYRKLLEYSHMLPQNLGKILWRTAVGRAAFF